MENSNESKKLRLWLLIAALLLCLAVIPVWPYGYYVFLRLVVCGGAAYAAFKLRLDSRLQKNFLPLVLTAVLFNPVITVPLAREIWIFIDLGAAVYFLNLSKKIK